MTATCERQAVTRTGPPTSLIRNRALRLYRDHCLSGLVLEYEAIPISDSTFQCTHESYLMSPPTAEHFGKSDGRFETESLENRPTRFPLRAFVPVPIEPSR